MYSWSQKSEIENNIHKNSLLAKLSLELGNENSVAHARLKTVSSNNNNHHHENVVVSFLCIFFSTLFKG